MPIIKSAKKALRASKRKHLFNQRRNNTMKDIVKDIKTKSKKEAEKLASTAYKAIDKAAKRGLIKKNTAARKKSRLMKSISKMK